jgi:hypothetical protein
MPTGLPALATDAIADALALDADSVDIAQIVAALTMADPKCRNSALRDVSDALLLRLDPECTLAAREAARARALARALEERDRIAAAAARGGAMEELRAACHDVGVPCARSRQETQARLAARTSELERDIARLEAPLSPHATLADLSSRRRAAIEAERDRLITATRAKTEFRLREKDLAQLACIEANNPHYRCAAPMRLYNFREVLSMSKELQDERDEALARRSAAAASKAQRDALREDRRRDIDVGALLGKAGATIEEARRWHPKAADAIFKTVCASRAARLATQIAQAAARGRELVAACAPLGLSEPDIRANDDEGVARAFVTEGAGSAESAAASVDAFKFLRDRAGLDAALARGQTAKHALRDWVRGCAVVDGRIHLGVSRLPALLEASVARKVAVEDALRGSDERVRREVWHRVRRLSGDAGYEELRALVERLERARVLMGAAGCVGDEASTIALLAIEEEWTTESARARVEGLFIKPDMSDAEIQRIRAAPTSAEMRRVATRVPFLRDPNLPDLVRAQLEFAPDLEACQRIMRAWMPTALRAKIEAATSAEVARLAAEDWKDMPPHLQHRLTHGDDVASALKNWRAREAILNAGGDERFMHGDVRGWEAPGVARSRIVAHFLRADMTPDMKSAIMRAKTCVDMERLCAQWNDGAEAVQRHLADLMAIKQCPVCGRECSLHEGLMHHMFATGHVSAVSPALRNIAVKRVIDAMRAKKC